MVDQGNITVVDGSALSNAVGVVDTLQQQMVTGDVQHIQTLADDTLESSAAPLEGGYFVVCNNADGGVT